MMHISFTGPRRKIVLFFSVLASGLIIFATVLTILLVSYSLNYQSKEILRNAWNRIASDYQANILEEVDIQLQQSNVYSEKFIRQQELPTIREKEVEFKNKKGQSKIDYGQNQKEEITYENYPVYTRIILENGDIPYTSDLFEEYEVNPYKKGFRTISTDYVCINAITSKLDSGEKAGAILQVAEYCAFPPKEQWNLFLRMMLVAGASLILTYFFGLLVAKWLLKPLEKSVKQTRKFAQNCYHELLTPVTVAMTSVDAALVSQNFEKGINSVREDLKNIYGSLTLLSSNAFWEEARLSMEIIDMKKVLRKVIDSLKEKVQLKNLQIDLREVKGSAINADEMSVKLIFQNLIVNAIKYAQERSVIAIRLDENLFTIENEVKNIKDLDTKKFFERYYRGRNGVEMYGKGVGLSIVKELVEIHRWRIRVNKTKVGKVKVEIQFKK